LIGCNHFDFVSFGCTKLQAVFDVINILGDESKNSDIIVVSNDSSGMAAEIANVNGVEIPQKNRETLTLEFLRLELN
jgi:hypothetical protein